MNLSDWAKQEIKLLGGQDADGYGNAVLNSAVKAFLSLCEDGHSGMSIGFTKQILDRLILCKPLAPLTGDDSEWECVGTFEDGRPGVNYQNKRCSSVFKYVYNDGVIEYNDVDRFVCEDIHSGSRFHNGCCKRIAAGYLPAITMPYYPPIKPNVIFVEDFLLDKANGDFDHRGVLYVIIESGEKIEIDRYQKEVDGKFVDITKEEYLESRKNRLFGTMDVVEEVTHSALTEVQTKVNKLDDPGKISDGHHTFDELYFHRMMLFSIICNAYKDVAWKSWKHDDNTMYDGMFIVGVTLPGGDYSYHYDAKFWDKFNVKELDKAPKWDGHMPDDINRLEELINEN